MKKTIAFFAALVIALAGSVNGYAGPDAPGTVLIQVQGGAFPGMGALLSANISMANIGKGHLLIIIYLYILGIGIYPQRGGVSDGI